MIDRDHRPADAGGARHRDPGSPIRPRLILAGVVVCSLFGGGLGAWAAMAPIDGAVIAPGLLNVASRRKVIQHFEGGIIAAIHVRDGDRVRAGEPLLSLKGVEPASEIGRLRGERSELRAAIARLEAEQNGAAQVSFPEDLRADADAPEIQAIMADQERMLAERRRIVLEREQLAGEQIGTLELAIASARRQIAALNRRRALALVKLGRSGPEGESAQAKRDRLFAFQQQLDDIAAELADRGAEIERARNEIAQIRTRLREAQANDALAVSAELRERRARLWSVDQRLDAADDVLKRTEIVSPIDGVIVNLQAHTIGGVVGAGAPILEIVPSDDELIVEAFVDPRDIDAVKPGVSAIVELTSQSRRRRTPLEGVVVDISADRLLNEQTGAPYYQARVRLTGESLVHLDQPLVAGMGADVFIRTGERTPIEYLTDPVARFLRAGLREE